MTIEHEPAPEAGGAAPEAPAPESIETPPAPEHPAPETPEAPAEPHPLEEGGRRFEQVIGQRNEARERARDLEARLAEADRQLQEARTAAAPKAAPVYTPDQIQAAIDGGQVSAAQGYAILARQEAAAAARQEATAFAERQRAQAAIAVIDAYVDRLPALAQAGTPERTRLERAARELGAEMGRSANDPVVQRLALKSEFGALDRLTARTQAAERVRATASSGLTTGGGGGQGTRPGGGATKDEFTDIPEHQKAFWDRLGYSVEQRRAEAKIVREKLAARAAREPRRTR